MVPLKGKSNLLWFNNASHELEPFEVRTGAQSHSDDVELSHLVENELRWPLSIFFASLCVGKDNLFHKLAERSLEFAVVLRSSQQVPESLKSRVKHIRPYSRGCGNQPTTR